MQIVNIYNLEVIFLGFSSHENVECFVNILQRIKIWIIVKSTLIETRQSIDIRKRDGLATLLLSIFYLQLSTPEANIAQVTCMVIMLMNSISFMRIITIVSCVCFRFIQNNWAEDRV